MTYFCSGMFSTLQVRKLEFLIAFLVLTIAACFFVELHYAKPDTKEVLKGLFVPQLKGNGATGLAISLLGAMVMPYVSNIDPKIIIIIIKNQYLFSLCYLSSSLFQLLLPLLYLLQP